MSMRGGRPTTPIGWAAIPWIADVTDPLHDGLPTLGCIGFLIQRLHLTPCVLLCMEVERWIGNVAGRPRAMAGRPPHLG